MLPRDLKKKLALTWSGPHTIVKVSHLAYQVEVTLNDKTELRWITRDKLKLECPVCVYDKRKVRDVVPDEMPSSSDSDSGKEEGEGRVVGKYQLRRNPAPVARYGNPVSHAIKVFEIMFQ